MIRRTGWTQQLGDGIRRDHRLACPASKNRRHGQRCECPYSFFTPTINGRRERARVYGTLADARRAKRQAQDAAELFRRTRANQLAGIVAMPTLDEWFDTLMEHEWRRVRIPSRERRIIDYRRLHDALGNKRLDQLTVPVIHAWLHRQIDIDGNRRCVQAAHETLEAMLAFAVQHRLLPDNAAKLVRYPVEHIQRRIPRVLSHDEYRALLDACRDTSERALLRILCEAGLRRSEAVALKVGDLDLDHGLIHIQRRHYRCADGSTDIDTPKARKTRWAAINPTLVACLREAIAGRENAAEAYIWTRQNRYTDGQSVPLTCAALSKVLARVSRHAGIDRVSPHLLRATGASLAVAAGVPESIAAKQLGNSPAIARKHYLRLPVIEPLRQIGAVFE
ncbi:MAG: transposase [Thermoleophilia bacterium]|nr:transposase [Thermoleophilia bacterium]